MKLNRNIEAISRDAMQSQRVSFQIEGINISKKKAEQIRQEVVQEFQKTATSSKSEKGQS